MQASCTICARVNTCSGIPAARHKPSLHKRSRVPIAFILFRLRGALARSISLFAWRSQERRETNEKSTRFRSLTLHTRALTCTAMIQVAFVYIRFSSCSLAESVRLKNNPKTRISCGTSLIAVKLSEYNDVTGSDHFK